MLGHSSDQKNHVVYQEMTEADVVAKLRECAKISTVSKKNCVGQTFICRLLYCVDADTLQISRYRDGFYETQTLRVARIDSGEVHHKQSEYIPDEKEAAYGNKAKLAVLHWFLPDHFQDNIDQAHDWRTQKSIFDKYPVLLRVECPTTCVENGKRIPLKLDPYSRLISEIKRYSPLSADDPLSDETLSDMLLRRKLANPYTGGKKNKNFQDA